MGDWLMGHNANDQPAACCSVPVMDVSELHQPNRVFSWPYFSGFAFSYKEQSVVVIPTFLPHVPLLKALPTSLSLT